MLVWNPGQLGLCQLDGQPVPPTMPFSGAFQGCLVWLPLTRALNAASLAC